MSYKVGHESMHSKLSKEDAAALRAKHKPLKKQKSEEAPTKAESVKKGKGKKGK